MSDLQAILDGLSNISAALHQVTMRLDVLEGRIGPPPMEIPPDLGREDCPEGVRYNPGDGYYYREVLTRSGLQSRKVCEDCWAVIPRYLDFPQGLISPESDGAGGTVAKTRMTTINGVGVSGMVGCEHLAKAVCLPCYVAAFMRCYPDAPTTVFNAATYPDEAVIPPTLTGAGLATVSMPGMDVLTADVGVA